MQETKFTKKHIKIASIALVSILGLFLIIGMMSGDDSIETDTGTTPVFTVEKGPLIISITKSGTIKAQEQVILKSEIKGRSTILFLIPEATRVKKGDLLVELDATKLQDTLIKQQIAHIL